MKHFARLIEALVRSCPYTLVTMMLLGLSQEKTSLRLLTGNYVEPVDLQLETLQLTTDRTNHRAVIANRQGW